MLNLSKSSSGQLSDISQTQNVSSACLTLPKQRWARGEDGGFPHQFFYLHPRYSEEIEAGTDGSIKSVRTGGEQRWACASLCWTLPWPLPPIFLFLTSN